MGSALGSTEGSGRFEEKVSPLHNTPSPPPFSLPPPPSLIPCFRKKHCSFFPFLEETLAQGPDRPGFEFQLSHLTGTSQASHYLCLFLNLHCAFSFPPPPPRARGSWKCQNEPVPGEDGAQHFPHPPTVSTQSMSDLRPQADRGHRSPRTQLTVWSRLCVEWGWGQVQGDQESGGKEATVTPSGRLLGSLTPCRGAGGCQGQGERQGSAPSEHGWSFRSEVPSPPFPSSLGTRGWARCQPRVGLRPPRPGGPG